MKFIYNIQYYVFIFITFYAPFTAIQTFFFNFSGHIFLDEWDYIVFVCTAMLHVFDLTDILYRLHCFFFSCICQLLTFLKLLLEYLLKMSMFTSPKWIVYLMRMNAQRQMNLNFVSSNFFIFKLHLFLLFVSVLLFVVKWEYFEWNWFSMYLFIFYVL